MLILAAVFVSDALIAYFAGRYLDVRQARDVPRALLFSALADAAIGVNQMGFIRQEWWAMLPSITGSGLGVWLSMRRRA